MSPSPRSARRAIGQRAAVDPFAEASLREVVEKNPDLEIRARVLRIVARLEKKGRRSRRRRRRDAN